MSSRLSQRLSFIHEHTPLSPTIYDIGCDHGDLGLSFLDSPKVQSLHLVDASLEVIRRLKSKLQEADIPKKVIIEQKKVQQLKIKNETCTIIMCGFGGLQIIEGIDHLSQQMQPDSHFVLSPHRDYLKMREHLSIRRFHVLQDLVVEERGHFYPLIVLAAQKGEALHPYGLNLWQTCGGRAFREHLLGKLKKHQNPKDQAFFKHLETL